MKPNSIVVVSLHSPKEKIWGQLLEINAAGVTVRGIDLDTFSEWLRELGGEQGFGLATAFYPLYRVEKIEMDEPVGEIPSLKESFQQKTGRTLQSYLDSLA